MIVLVAKDNTGELHHMRMDRPFEMHLAKLITAVVTLNEFEEGFPREVCSVWVEEMTVEEYNAIPATNHTLYQAPRFIQNT